jgi:hypothetical protein
VSRRLIFLLAIPALALIAWLVAAQLPRWTAPQPGWFAADTPGVCAAVSSLVLYGAARTSVGGIAPETAKTAAAKLVSDHYGISPLTIGEPLAVQATLPNQERQTYYVVTAALSNDAPPKAAVIYLDAATDDPRALITATEDPALNCAFNVRAALLAALRSPPPILLAAYLLIAAGALAARALRGRHR